MLKGICWIKFLRKIVDFYVMSESIIGKFYLLIFFCELWGEDGKQIILGIENLKHVITVQSYWDFCRYWEGFIAVIFCKFEWRFFEIEVCSNFVRKSELKHTWICIQFNSTLSSKGIKKKLKFSIQLDIGKIIILS